MSDEYRFGVAADDAGNDTLVGTDSDDVLNGGAGDDVIDGGKGDDWLVGGAGNDAYVYNLGSGYDYIDASGNGANEYDVIYFGAGITPDQVSVRHGHEGTFEGTLRLKIKGTFDGLEIRNDEANPVEQIIFADGTVWGLEQIRAMALVGDDDSSTVIGYAGNDLMDGGKGNDGLYGFDGADTLIGGAGDDYLFGHSGNDVLNGGEGDDWLEGGEGDNTYLFDAGSGQDTIEGMNTNDGYNVIRFGPGITADQVTLTRTFNSTLLSIKGTSDRVLLLQEAGTSPIDQIFFADGTTWGLEQLRAMALIGTDGNDLMNGYTSDDRIEGGKGNDTLGGSLGADTVLGGDGDDFLYGNSIESNLGDNSNDRLEGGNGNDTMYGGGGNDTLIGGEGDDILDGGDGNDVLVDGAGSDTYMFKLGSGSDRIDSTESGAGNDVIQLGPDISPAQLQLSRFGSTLKLSIQGTSDSLNLTDYFLPSSYNHRWDRPDEINRYFQVVFADGTTWNLREKVRGMVLQGSDGDDKLIGDASDERIKGGAGHDTLLGGLGADKLAGNDGDDVLDGGAGNDTLWGGASTYGETNSDNGGHDTYLFGLGSGHDVVHGDLGDTVRFGPGITPDQIVLSIQREMSETLSMVLTIKGSADSLTLYGYFSESGAPRAETLGKFVFDNGVIWDFSSITAALGQTQDGTSGNDSLGSFGIGGFGNDTLNGFAGDDNLSGRGGDDVLNGGLGKDTLRGGAGNDLLNGGNGADNMRGETGDDTYIVDNLGDVVTEVANQGFDLVKVGFGTNLTGVTYTLPDQVEQLVLTGSTAFNATGNAQDNFVSGNSAANTLSGRDGDDVLLGGGGADLLMGDAGHDKLDGGNGADTLMGGAGDDSLDGGSGADRLMGGSGNDLYKVTSASDVVLENVNEGIDLVHSTINYTLGANLENLTLTGNGATKGTGNSLHNELMGNSAANTLKGLGGNDTLMGMEGVDTLIGGAGNDTYLMARGDGADVVRENDSTANNFDTLQFSSSITADQLWFRKVGNSLEVSIIGTSDKTTVQNWYLGNQYRVEQLQLEDGGTLMTSKVQALVSAMAAFAPPAMGQTTLPPDYDTSLLPVISAHWGS